MLLHATAMNVVENSVLLTQRNSVFAVELDRFTTLSDYPNELYDQLQFCQSKRADLSQDLPKLQVSNDGGTTSCLAADLKTNVDW